VQVRQRIAADPLTHVNLVDLSPQTLSRLTAGSERFLASTEDARERFPIQ
jgi:hypothetical protein